MVTHSDSKLKLLRLLQAKSVFYGDFLLSSGAKSSYYIDCRLTTLDPEGAWLIGEVMYDLIKTEAKGQGHPVDGVGGLTMGADPISLAVSMQSFKDNPGRPLNCFVVRKSPKAHGQTKLIEGNFKKGDRVVVIDDVVTTGESTLKAIQAVEDAGGVVAFVAVLVDRQQGGRENIEKHCKVISAFKRDELIDPARAHQTADRVAA
jgi:orotate phosphoribosyltransferase